MCVCVSVCQCVIMCVCVCVCACVCLCQCVSDCVRMCVYRVRLGVPVCVLGCVKLSIGQAPWLGARVGGEGGGRIEQLCCCHKLC